MRLIKISLGIIILCVHFQVSGQLSNQKIYADSLSIYGSNCKILDLNNNGLLLYNKSQSGRIIRLNNNFDTLWVKSIPNFFISDAILNANNEIILVGQKDTAAGNTYPNNDFQVLKIGLNGNLIQAKSKNLYSGGISSSGTLINPSIIEYKPNNYIIGLFEFFNGIFYIKSHLLKLDSNLTITESKFDFSDINSPISQVLFKPTFIQKGDNEIIIYKNNDYGYYDLAVNRFFVIDTNLNNTFHKELSDTTRRIKTISFLGDDLIIGGDMRSTQLIHNQFDNNDYPNSFLTRINLSNPGTLRNRSLLFCSSYSPKNNYFSNTFFYYLNNFIYAAQSTSDIYSTGADYSNDSLSRNFRTRLFKFDTAFQMQWNKRLHIYGTMDNTGFQMQYNGQTPGLLKSSSVLFNKNNQLLNLSYHWPTYSNSTNVSLDEVGFALSAIDTSGSNATCNATDEAVLQKYDSLEVFDKPLLLLADDTFALHNSFQSILDIPLRKISNVCLPLKKTISKFFWQATNSNGFNDVVCKDSKIFIYDRSYNEPKTWHWIFPPQANVSELDSLYLPNVQSISFNQVGVFPVKLVTTNDAGNDTSTQFITVINYIPQPVLGNDTLLCQGDTLKVFYQNPPNSLHYFTGPGLYTTNDTLQIVSSGQYILTAYTACGFLYDTIIVNFASKPTANFGFAAACNSLNVIFTDSSLLNFNPGLTYTYAVKPALAPPAAYTNFSTTPNNNFTFAAYDSFDVRLIVKSTGNCVQSDTIIKRIVLRAKPVAACNYINACGSLAIDITNASSIAAGSISSYQYFLGNTLIASTPSFTYSFASYGSYMIKQVVQSSYGCLSDTFYLPVVVKDKPALDLAVLQDSLCANTPFTITANATVAASSITNYTWFNNGNLLSNTNNQLSDNQPTGIYIYKVIATDANGCNSDTTSQIVTVVSKPTTTLNAVNICGSKQINITAAAAVVNDQIISHYVSYGDGNTSSSNPNNTTYTYTNFGTYTLKYVAKSSIGCAADTVYFSITVKDKPLASITYNSNACQNTNYVLTASASVNASSISSYTWIKNGLLLPNSSPTLTENNLAGSYNYKLIATSAQGCSSDTVMQNVTVEKYPTTNFSAAGNCVGQSLVLTNNSIDNNTNNSSGLQYVWIVSDGQTSTAILPGFSFASSGTKTIQLTTSTQNGCATSITKTILVEDYPTAAFDITEACLGKPITITNNSTGAISNYTWQTNNGQVSNALLPNFTFNNEGNYSIQLQLATQNNCTDNTSKTFSIRAVQLFTSPAADTNALINQPIQLNISGAATYLWSPTIHLNNATGSSPVFTANTAGIYPLQVQGTTAQGCKGNVSLTIKVFNSNNYVLIPNAFTPNADGLNDRLRLVCSGLKALTSFIIYNRWGQPVYQQNTCNQNNGWDGSFNGIAQPTGNFVYQWQGIDFNNKKVSGRGNVILIR